MSVLTLDSVPHAARHTVVYSHVLGDLHVRDDSIVHFAHGLLGFPLYQRYALLPDHDDLYWLQSMDERTLTFLLVDPFRYFPSYEVQLGLDTVAGIEAQSAGDVLVLCVATMTAPGHATANLRGPLVFNARTRIARQVAVGNVDADLRAPFAFAPLAAAS